MKKLVKGSFIAAASCGGKQMGKLVLYMAIAIAILASSFTGLSSARASGGDNPFPLDYPLPFPWSTIEGVWSVENRDFSAYFSFQVQNDCDGRQILKVLEIDPDSQEVMSEGIGYKLQRSEQVTAAMSGMSGSYMIYVGAYEDTHVSPPKKAYVLRVVSFTSGSAELRIKMRKVKSKVPRRDPGGTDCFRTR